MVLKKILKILGLFLASLAVVIVLYNGIWFFVRDPDSFGQIYYWTTLSLLAITGIMRFKRPAIEKKSYFELLQTSLFISQLIAFYELMRTQAVSDWHSLGYLLLTLVISALSGGKYLRDRAIAYIIILLLIFLVHVI